MLLCKISYWWRSFVNKKNGIIFCEQISWITRSTKWVRLAKCTWSCYNYELANTPDWYRRREIAEVSIVRIKHYCGRDEASFTGNLLSFSRCWENAKKLYEKAETEEASHRFHSCWRPRLEWGYIFIVKSPCAITCSLLINRVYIFPIYCTYVLFRSLGITLVFKHLRWRSWVGRY